jgi:hypothetical protein
VTVAGVAGVVVGVVVSHNASPSCVCAAGVHPACGYLLAFSCPPLLQCALVSIIYMHTLHIVSPSTP